MTAALEEAEGSASFSGRSLPPGKTRYPLYRRLGGLQGRSGQVRKISDPTGIRSPDRPDRSQSLYRLCYPAHTFTFYYGKSYERAVVPRNITRCNRSSKLKKFQRNTTDSCTPVRCSIYMVMATFVVLNTKSANSFTTAAYKEQDLLRCDFM